MSNADYENLYSQNTTIIAMEQKTKNAMTILSM